MTAHFGSKKINQVYLGTQNTNCLTSVPKNVKLELTYGAWTQPIFSSNTNGSLTLSASHESQPAWYAFNGDKTTNDNCWWTNHGVTSTSNPCWIQLKSAIKLKLNQVVIRNEHQSPENFKTAYLQVSNDGSSWTNVVTISGTNTGGYETTVNFAVSDGYYYYRLYFTESYSAGGVSIQTITFSGTAQNRLTLKAGSKVYVPNGFESDGTTPKFDEVVVESDYTIASSHDDTWVAFFGQNYFAVRSLKNQSGSGTSTPTSNYWIYYNTNDNKIYNVENGTIVDSSCSLPFAIVTATTSGIKSIDQIFDWCGYIGSTQFLLPGIKGLKSNGLKADGTYNNIEIETKSVILHQYDYIADNQQVGIGGNGNWHYRTSYYYSQATAPAATVYSLWHNTKDNFNYFIGADTSTGWVKTPDFDFLVITSISTDSSYKFTSFTPATVKPLTTTRKINYIFKGSQLVYASTVPDKPYLKKPDYSNVTSLSNGTVYNTLDGDIWLNVVFNTNANVSVDVSKNSDMSNSTTIVYATWHGGVSSCKGGCILPIPKGYYFKSTNAGGLSKIGIVSNLSGRISYKLKDKVAKLPDYTTQTPLAQNAVAAPSDKPRWLYSYGSTRIVQVSKDNSTWITIATGVTSATVEPSAMFYIPAGYYVKTTGTSNTLFPCMEA